MKRTNVQSLLVLFVLVFFISSCLTVTSDSVNPTAIEKTQIAQITDTQVYTTASFSTDTPNPATAAVLTATQEPEYFLGDAVYKNGYALTALSVQDPYVDSSGPAANDSYGVQNNKFIAVEVIISNISGEPFFSDMPKIIDKDGFSYDTAYLGLTWSELQLFYSAWLQPGEKIRGIIVFDTPAGFIPSNIVIDTNFQDRENPDGPLLIEKNLLSLNPAPEGHVAIAEPNSELPVNKLPAMGTPVIKEGYSLTVLEMNNSATPVPHMPNYRDVGYKYFGINILLENISGTNPVWASGENAYIVDDKGFLYRIFYQVTGQIMTSELDTGGKAKGWVIIGIPEDATPYSFIYVYDGGPDAGYGSGNKSEKFLQSGLSQ